jgi:hypothetical protein
VVLAVVPAERCRRVAYALPWNATSTLGAATNAQYFYDYAGQDPINGYDLSGDLAVGPNARIAVCGLGAGAALCFARHLEERLGIRDDGAIDRITRIERRAANLERQVARDHATPAEVRSLEAAENRFTIYVRGVKIRLRWSLREWAFKSGNGSVNDALDVDIVGGEHR